MSDFLKNFIYKQTCAESESESDRRGGGIPLLKSRTNSLEQRTKSSSLKFKYIHILNTNYATLP